MGGQKFAIRGERTQKHSFRKQKKRNERMITLKNESFLISNEDEESKEDVPFHITNKINNFMETSRTALLGIAGIPWR